MKKFSIYLIVLFLGLTSCFQLFAQTRDVEKSIEQEKTTTFQDREKDNFSSETNFDAKDHGSIEDFLFENKVVKNHLNDVEEDAEKDLELVGAPKVDTDEAFETMNFKGAFFRMIIALVVVLALAFVTLNYIVPKLSRRRFHPTKSKIKILERIPLDAKKHLYVLQVEDRRLLISSTDHNVALITELKTHEEDSAV
ncbi:MAG: FliO/MopB family protein [Deltaproteobacteria bacterium]|nr:FliO/MopB family protein [Deltaproteobacteria bacterium]